MKINNNKQLLLNVKCYLQFFIEDNHKKMVQSGTIAEVVIAMKSYLNSPLIQECGCKVLALLSYGKSSYFLSSTVNMLLALF